ncbi:MAG: 16S rRNA (guanine(527)-N(7))-methyltransferase RsmG [Nitrospiraceae bacterium]|nr:16S rRNA (guanine(527)-N(7))-methyltransferase RsmG [Nitrospiraceae bacterium]
MREGLKELGISFTEEQIASFSAYLAELKKWSRVHNLTGLKEDRDIIIKHFLDSLLFLRVFPDDALSMADVGSGAGFPGIPLKIMRPELDVFLIEPSEKKCVFLRHMKALLGLKGLYVLTGRVEDIRELKVDAAVSRALFRISDFVEKAGHILRENGLFILNKGPKLEEEMRGIDLQRVEVSDIRLPFGNAVRRMVTIKN